MKNSVYSANKSVNPPIIIELKIAGKKVQMEVDSGAVVSVLPEALYNSTFKHCKLEKSNKVLTLYDGNTIVPLGKINVEVEYKQKKEMCILLIVKRQENVALMGRDLMKIFSLQILEVKNLTSDMDIETLLCEFQDLFSSDLGKLKNKKVHLEVLPGTRPIFIKPRVIPFAFKSEVEKELDRLEKIGVIEKIESSDWGTPLVPILKSDGKIRVCADYKVTVNKSLVDIKYPVPRIEELFAALQGGELFTKLDLASAFNQLEVSDETRYLLAWSTHRGIYAMNRLTFGTKVAVAVFQK